ncbi:MAG: caspase family protein [Cyclobacteriaceae bacterium]|nr:caspase family protein [Cyclobacteriaceae bacterium]
MKTHVKSITIIVCLCCTICTINAQDITVRTGKFELDLTKEDERPTTSDEVVEERYHALLIGIRDYDDPNINDLTNPLSDLQSMYSVLTEKYTFKKENVRTLENPTREEMIVALDRLSSELTDNDNLLIFYAGHGYFNDKTNQGYWLPSDAQNIESGNTSRWFRNTTLVDYIGAIPTKHTLLISDACFSGSIFKSRAAFNNASLAYAKLYRLKSRKAMTSGSIETVSDNSVFLKYLLSRLTDNENKYATSEELFSSIRIAVMNNSSSSPLFGEIQNAGDEGGDFLFVKRD